MCFLTVDSLTARAAGLVLCSEGWGKRRLLDAANRTRIKLGERETFCTEVLQRCADEVDFLVVDNEKAVVECFVVADGEFWLLLVEGLHVSRGNLAVRHALLVVMLRREDRHFHARALLREEVQRLDRRPVVDE